MRRNIVLFVSATLVAVIIGEGALRLLNISYPVNLYRYDPDRGSALRPGANGVWRDEGEGVVSINSDGLRDREHVLTKPSGFYRIAILGDSYAEALQVDRDRTFWALLETRLNEEGCGGKPVEIINFGVSGYGTAQELITLRTKVWKYDPDMVLLLFLSGNDLRNNSKRLEPDKDRPFFTLAGKGLALDDSFRERITASPAYQFQRSTLSGLYHWLINHSRILQALLQVRKVWRSGYRERATTPAGLPAEAGIDSTIYRPPVTPAWKEAWEITERLLHLFGEEVVARGAHAVVVTATNGVQVDPDPVRWKHYVAVTGEPDLFYPERRIASVAAHSRFTYIPLAPVMAAHARETGDYLHGFGKTLGAGHWNEKGHALAARIIGATLCETVLAR